MTQSQMYLNFVMKALLDREEMVWSAAYLSGTTEACRLCLGRLTGVLSHCQLEAERVPLGHGLVQLRCQGLALRRDVRAISS